MALDRRNYIVPAKVSVQQIVQALQKMGYRYKNTGMRHATFLYYDSQGGKLFRGGFRLRFCALETGEKLKTTKYSQQIKGEKARTWQLFKNGSLLLSQSADDDKVPAVGVIADHLTTLTAPGSLLPYVWARVSGQEILLNPPSPERRLQGETEQRGAEALPDELSMGLRFENWDFRSPFRSNWSNSHMVLVLDAGTGSAEADYLHTLLRDYVGLQPVAFEPFTNGLESIRAALPGVPVPNQYQLTPEDNVYTAVGKVLGKQRYKMWGNTEGTVYDLDIEFLHDLRVATRRARFALQLFREYIGEDRSETLRKELSWIAKSLGKVRDIDVFQEKFSEQFRKIGASEDIIQLVVGHYAGKRHKNLDKIKEDLLSERYLNLLEHLREVGDGMMQQGCKQGSPVVEIVPGFIGAALDRMSGWLDRSAVSLSVNDLHELRIEFKGLRYTTEFFADLYSKEMRRIIRGFVKFQDCLGLYQDAQVATETLRKFSGKILKKGSASVDVMLGVGGLMQVQREIQEQQHAQFLTMWSRFPKQMKELHKILHTVKYYVHA
jgi:CHAD domain-containing protein